MTYRERRMRKAERLREWAAKRAQRAEATFTSHKPYTSDIAFNTQPGHIPFRARIIAQEDREFRSLEKAQEMATRADSIEAQTDRAIYSDDPDAIKQLEARIADLEAERCRIKYINIEIRKGTGWAERITPPLTDKERRDLEMAARFNGDAGYPTYALSNLGGNIRRYRERLEKMEGGRNA